MKNSLVNKLDDIFEWIYIDVPDEFIIPDFKKIVAAESGQAIVDYFVSKLDGRKNDDVTFALHYLGVVGIKEAIPLLKEHHDGHDEREVFWAAVGLAHLGVEDAFETLRKFADRSHPLSNLVHPYDDVLDELKEMEDMRASELISQFDRGKFGKPTDP